MNSDILYDMVRSHQRNGANNLVALYQTLKTANAEMLPFQDEHKQLFIRIDNEASQNINILMFLCGAVFMKWDIQVIDRKAWFHVYSKE